MKKHVIREMGLEPVDKIANGWQKLIIIIFWLVLSASIIAVTFSSLVKIVKLLNPPPDDYYIASQGIDISWQEGLLTFHLITLLGTFVVWLLLKSVMATLFCEDKVHGVKIKFLENSVVPTSYCSEGMKIWQMVLVYLVPVVSIYIAMFILCILMDAEGGFMTVFCLVSLFMVLDIELIAYMLILKIKDKAKYISVNNHIYNITVFK